MLLNSNSSDNISKLISSQGLGTELAIKTKKSEMLVKVMGKTKSKGP